MISHKYRCIFVEVPKTGSRSVRELIGRPPRPHLDICQIRDEMRQHWTHHDGRRHYLYASLYLLLPEAKRRSMGERQFREYFKFGFVRNPWDRVVSLYLRKEGIQLRDSMRFEEFVDWIRYSSSTCIYPVPHVNQLDWFVDGSGNLLVDFIGKFERLQQDWAPIAAKLGLPGDLPHVNQNPIARKHYTEYYTDRTRDIIAQRFRVDIERFEYDFGG